jgi:hypothetical protein
MSKKNGGKSKPSKPGKSREPLDAANASGRRLLSGVVQLATRSDEFLDPISELDPDKLHDIAFRFKSLIEDTVDLMGAEEAAKFFITATATAFGGAEELASSLADALNELTEPEMEIYRLKVAIRDAPVKIERIIDVPDCSLGYLNEVIQCAFGWANSHLHVFDVDREQFGPILDDDMGMSEWQDESTVLLSDLLTTKKKTKLTYTYDMGDNWQHQVELISRTPVEKRAAFAVCVDGKGQGPPEDCGGVWGYGEMLERLKKGKPEEFDFLEPDYDANLFDSKDANAKLKRLKWKDFH